MSGEQTFIEETFDPFNPSEPSEDEELEALKIAEASVLRLVITMLRISFF